MEGPSTPARQPLAATSSADASSSSSSSSSAAAAAAATGTAAGGAAGGAPAGAAGGAPGTPAPAVSPAPRWAISPAESQELSQKWDAQFKEIQQALEDARRRYSAELGPANAATTQEEKVARLMELLDLKNLALEGMETKVRQAKEQMHELAELRRQLAESNKLYFHSLVLNMKMNSLHSGTSYSGKSNVDSQQLFEKCVQERVALADWPTFVSKHF